jgi:hypothetical protein
MSAPLFSDEQPTDPPRDLIYNEAISAVVDLISKESQRCDRVGQFFRKNVCTDLINKISCLKR